MIASFLILILGISAVTAQTYTCDPTAPCGCSISSVTATAKIVGGQDAPNHAWGWMLSMRYNGHHICGATLIAPNFAITSAHCLSTNIAVLQRYTIVAGTNYLDDGSATVQTRSLEAIYINPGYNFSGFAKDFAMIRFADLTLGPTVFVSKICYPTQGQDPFTVGDNLIAIGWGAERYGSAVAPNALQQVTLQVIDTSSPQCINASVRDPVFRFCASASGKDTCQGDSGGPLMAFSNSLWYIAGMPTSGKGCAVTGNPGLYTRISEFADYIQSVFDNPDSSTILIPAPTSSPSTASTVSSSSSSTESSTGSSGNNAYLPRASISCSALALGILLLIFQ